MGTIEQRVKRVVASKTTSYVVDKLVGDDRDRLEAAREREQQARMDALARAAARDRQINRGSESGTTPDAIRELMEEEDCPVCTRILESLAEMDEPRRTRGVAEYGEFRSAIEESEEAAVQTLESADVLPDALQNLREVQL